MKIVIFNVKYSDNLGDGIIAECLEHTLNKYLPESLISSMDVSGRESYGGQGALSSSVKAGGLRSLLINIHDRLPNIIKNAIFIMASKRIINNTLMPKWLDEIKESDVIVIGGGHLFGNDKLYFPLRLHAIHLALKEIKKPAAIYSVGIDKIIDNKGLSYFSQIVNDENIFFVSVRDADANASWQRNFNSTPDQVTRDPGLLACDVYADFIDENVSSSSIKTIGINIMADHITELEKEELSKPLPKNEDLFYDVGLKLSSLGYKVAYFSKGLQADELLKDRIESRILANTKAEHSNIVFLERLTTPTELATCISKLDALVAHRLHANILAYSMKVPHVGIGWSIKVDGFFSSIDRSKYFVASDSNLSSELIVDKILETLSEGIDGTTHNKIVTESRKGIQELASAIVATKS